MSKTPNLSTNIYKATYIITQNKENKENYRKIPCENALIITFFVFYSYKRKLTLSVVEK